MGNRNFIDLLGPRRWHRHNTTAAILILTKNKCCLEKLGVKDVDTRQDGSASYKHANFPQQAFISLHLTVCVERNSLGGGQSG